ncbi:hypothetical protein [Sphingomonas sp.]|jgi:hypothetical protein|uniref:hypothetical protein n=1 Tax=Sphingomonas sp. TaxID=28214 RepID=UPI002E12CED3|nr:hypothetical protein [Sphingomonas sp.]
MSTRTEFKINRSGYRANRAAVLDLIDKQNNIVDREFLLSTVIFRIFFLVGPLVVMMTQREALIGAAVLFFVVSFIWIYRALLNERINSKTIMWTEKILFSAASRNAHFSPDDEERDQEFVDDLIRIRTVRPAGLLPLYFEPLALLMGVELLIFSRLFYGSIYNLVGIN